MNRKSFTLIFLLFVISSVHSQIDPVKILNNICEDYMKGIKAGTFEKRIKERQECYKKVAPKDVYDAFVKCEEAFPMSTADQVTKVCSNIDDNASKVAEFIACGDKVLNIKYSGKFSDCGKLMNPDIASN